MTKTTRRFTARSNAQPARRFLPSRCALCCAYTLALFVFSPITSAAASQDAPATSLLAVPARTWALDCANSEVPVMQHPNSYLRYRLHTIDGKGDQLRDQIETPEGTVSHLIQRDGRSLTPAEDSAERDRLTGLATSPTMFARHIRHDEDNRKTGIEMVRMMPEAMLWSYSPGQPQLPSHSAGDPALIVLDFKPNPKWSPPSLDSELLTGLAGRVWIDPRSRAMVHLEANLFRAVNVGWGMLAHVYPGGTAMLQQTNVSGQRWVMEHIVEQFTLQALLVKNIKQKLISDAADFQPVAPTSYRQAIEILLNTPLPRR